MALSLQLASTPSLVTVEVPLLPALVFQAYPIAPPPLSSPQLLTTPVMGVTSLPPALTPLTAQHYTPSSGGQPLGLAGAQYP